MDCPTPAAKLTIASRIKLSLLAAVLLAAPPILVAQTAPDANSAYKSIREEVQRTYKAKDYPALLNAAKRAVDFTNGNSRWVLNLAGCYALAGQKDDAFRTLQRVANMNIDASDSLKDDDFASLHNDPRWKSILQHFAKNNEKAGISKLVASLEDPGLLTEDIAWSQKTRNFYLTSVRKKKVLRVGANSEVTTLADLSSEPGWPLFAIVADDNRGALWVTAAANPDFVPAPKADSGRSTLLEVNVRTGQVLHRYELPDDGTPHVLGDAALTSDGALIISDGLNGSVYLFHPKTGKFMDIGSRQFISPQTPVSLAFATIVPDYVRGLGVVVPCLDNCEYVHWLKNKTSLPLNGIDGLYRVPAFGDKEPIKLIAIQNGTTPQRILELQLDSKLTAVESATILRSDPALGDITHGVFVDGKFQFIANSGWDQLDEKGNPKSGVKPTAPAIHELVSEPKPRGH